MHFEGQHTIAAPVAAVWDFFLDPARVSACVPGFKGLELIDPEHFRPTVAAGVGPVKATFTLDAVLSDIRPPEHVTMSARGNAGGSAVDMKGQMDLLPESETVTGMKWLVDVTVSGTIASVGSRLLEGTAHKLTDKFFDTVRSVLETPSKTSE